MLLQRLYDDKLAPASDLLDCQAAGEALGVDPDRGAEQRDAEQRDAEFPGAPNVPLPSLPGRADVLNFAGGLDAWRAAGLPAAHGPAAATPSR